MMADAHLLRTRLGLAAVGGGAAGARRVRPGLDDRGAAASTPGRRASQGGHGRAGGWTGLVPMSVAQAPVEDPRAAFERELGVIRQRIWLERAGVVVTRGLTLGFGLTLVFAVTAWMMRYPVPPLWYAVPLLVPLALSLIVAAFRYPSAMSAARIADHRLELSEQLGTAVEIVDEDSEELLAWAQVSSATQTATWADQNWRGGPRLGRDLALAALLGFIAAGALLLTGPEGRSVARAALAGGGAGGRASGGCGAVAAGRRQDRPAPGGPVAGGPAARSGTRSGPGPGTHGRRAARCRRHPALARGRNARSQRGGAASRAGRVRAEPPDGPVQH